MWDGGFIVADRAKLKQKTFTQVVTTFSFYSPFLKVITVENLVIGSLHEDCKNSVISLITLHFLKKTYNLKKLCSLSLNNNKYSILSTPFLILTQDYFCHTLNACSTQTVMITSHFGLELFAGECRLAHNLKTRQLLSAKTLIVGCIQKLLDEENYNDSLLTIFS